MSWYGSIKLPNFGKDVFPKLNPQDIKLLPIYKRIEDELIEFVEKADIMLDHNKLLQETKSHLIQMLDNNFALLRMNRKLEQWPSLTFGELVKELEKQKIKMSLSQQAEWMPYFEEQKAKAQQLQQTITAIDKEIDKMVYALYELTDEEIALVEG